MLYGQRRAVGRPSRVETHSSNIIGKCRGRLSLRKKWPSLLIAPRKDIPFGVGKKLLTSYIQGKTTHESIKKNRLDRLDSFGTLAYEDDEIEQGEVCGKIQSRKWIGKLVAPVSGEITEINEEMEEDTGLINTDPYGDGWILVIEAEDEDDLQSELKNLIHGDAVQDFVDREIAKTEEEKAKAE